MTIKRTDHVGSNADRTAFHPANDSVLVKRISSFENLQSHREQWDRLAGDNLFLSWAWISTWWKHYGDSCSLHVLLFFNSEMASDKDRNEAEPGTNQLIGILPTYIESRLGKGKVVRLLGDGEVCSDHLDILAAKQDLHRVVAAAAKYFVDQPHLWDATDFNSVGQDCEGLNLLGCEFKKQGCRVNSTPNVGRWSIPLPKDRESFLAMLSKSHRKKLRRLSRSVLETERANWKRVETAEQLATAWPIFADLHQRRRNSLNEPGCFASDRWANFHSDMAGQLLEQGQLRLSWLELDGQPIAAEYQFANSTTSFAYQGGLDPDRLNEQPGRLSLFCSIEQAIQEGHSTFDLMRGDEPYKVKWRAEQVPTFDLCVVSPNAKSVLRNRAIGYLKSTVGAARSVRGSFSAFAATMRDQVAMPFRKKEA